MKGSLLALAVSSVLAAGLARADEGAVEGLEDLGALQRACEEAERRDARHLYAVRVPAAGWRFAPYDRRGRFLPVDTRQNLRLFGGAAELFPSRLEPMGFRASPERARALRAAAQAGAALRIGFFLGFDNPERTLCLVRPAMGVTTARMDVAFLELVDGDGEVLAREDTDRLRAWMDDREREAIPGEGPRGAMSAASVATGAGIAPEPWQQALVAANRGDVGRAIGRCHAEGLERGATDEGQVVVRLEVEVGSGRVTESAVELSSIGERREARCIATALRSLRFPPAPDAFDADRVQLSVPVRLKN